MSRKSKEETIDWLGPRMRDENGQHPIEETTHYASTTKMVRGRLVWQFVPITEGYRAKCAKRRAEAMKLK